MELEPLRTNFASYEIYYNKRRGDCYKEAMKINNQEGCTKLRLR